MNQRHQPLQQLHELPADHRSRLEHLFVRQRLAAGEAEPAAAAAVVGTLRVLIPLAGLIDLDAERTRLDKEIARIQVEIKKCEGKLGNANFIDHAPAAVVEQERNRLADWNGQLDALRGQAKRLSM